MSTAADHDRPACHCCSGASGGRKLQGPAGRPRWCTAAFVVAMIPLVWLLWTVISKGSHAAVRRRVVDEFPARHRPAHAGRRRLARASSARSSRSRCAALISVPIGVLVAIYLVEYGRGPARPATTLHGRHPVRRALDRRRAVHLRRVHHARSAGQRPAWPVRSRWSLLMIPVIVRTTEEMLKLVPNELREASYALGVPKWKTILKIVLPTAFTGIVTGVVLGVARVAGETAPLLILAAIPEGDQLQSVQRQHGAPCPA